jgi:hypothetical protein
MVKEQSVNALLLYKIMGDLMEKFEGLSTGAVWSYAVKTVFTQKEIIEVKIILNSLECSEIVEDGSYWTGIC